MFKIGFEIHFFHNFDLGSTLKTEIHVRSVEKRKKIITIERKRRGKKLYVKCKHSGLRSSLEK